MNERTYTNPVYGGYLGDPFVLKHNGEYYAYGTGPDDGDGHAPLSITGPGERQRDGPVDI